MRSQIKNRVGLTYIRPLFESMLCASTRAPGTLKTWITRVSYAQLVILHEVEHGQGEDSEILADTNARRKLLRAGLLGRL